MNNLRTLLPLALLSAQAACASEGDSYVFLADLCSTYAEDVCSARARCCEEVLDCARTVARACDDARTELVERTELSYNAAHASRVRARSIAELERCSAPLAVSAFFDGTLPLDAECADDLACVSGFCQIDGEADTGSCVAAEEALCPAS